MSNRPEKFGKQSENKDTGVRFGPALLYALEAGARTTPEAQKRQRGTEVPLVIDSESCIWVADLVYCSWVKRRWHENAPADGLPLGHPLFPIFQPDWRVTSAAERIHAESSALQMPAARHSGPALPGGLGGCALRYVSGQSRVTQQTVRAGDVREASLYQRQRANKTNLACVPRGN